MTDTERLSLWLDTTAEILADAIRNIGETQQCLTELDRILKEGDHED